MARTRCPKLSSVAVACALAAMSPSAARAQAVDPDTAAAAQTLFEQASAEMDRKQYASACPRFEEVTRLIPSGLGAKLALGECWEAQGKLASAWSQYALVQSLAASAGQTERSQEAGAKAAALRPRLATLTIEVPDRVSAITGVTVARNGVLLGGAQFGTPIPVDAGAHDIVVSAPEHTPWRKRVEVVADGASVTVEVSAPTPGVPSKPEAPPSRPWQRPVAIGVMGLGAAAAGVGAALGVVALEKNGQSNADNHCNLKDFCDPAGAALRNDARAFGNGATAAIIAGGATFALGVVLFALAPAARKETTAIQVEIRPGALGLRGTW